MGSLCTATVERLIIIPKEIFNNDLRLFPMITGKPEDIHRRIHCNKGDKNYAYAYS